MNEEDLPPATPAGRTPRQGWEDAFREMAARSDDRLLNDFSLTLWDEEEWVWEADEE